VATETTLEKNPATKPPLHGFLGVAHCMPDYKAIAAHMARAQFQSVVVKNR